MTVDSAILNSLLVALASIILDMLMGVAISVKNSTFSLSKLPQFLANNVFPYVGGLIILAVFANYVSNLAYLYYAGVGLVTVKFSKEALIDKLKLLFE
jgi:hypothetical protein